MKDKSWEERFDVDLQWGNFTKNELRHFIREVESQAIRRTVERIRTSKIWKLVPDTPRMIMCSDKELDELLSPEPIASDSVKES